MTENTSTTYATYRLTNNTYSESLEDEHGHVCVDEDTSRYVGPVGEHAAPLGLLENLGGMGELEDLEELEEDDLDDYGVTPDDFTVEQSLEDRITGDDGFADTSARECLEAVVEYYHSNLTEDDYAHIEDKWGIDRETVDELKIGRTGSGFTDAVEYLRNEGFDDVTILRSGVASSSFVKNVVFRRSSDDKSNYDEYPEELQTVIDKRENGVIEPSEFDLEAVIEYGKEIGEYRIGAWWDSRIVFPYWSYEGDDDGVARYLIGRETEDTNDLPGAKYIKLSTDNPVVDSSEIYEPIYGHETVEEGERLIIVEGIADAIAAHQAGFSCISPVTTKFKSEHHDPLLKHAEDAGDTYLVFDNEETATGLDNALRTAAFLDDEGVDVQITDLPRPEGVEKVDPADYLMEHDHADLLEVLLDNSKHHTEHSQWQEDKHATTDYSEEYRPDRNPQDVEPSQSDGNQSALWDLDLSDVVRNFGVGAGYRGDNPIEHEGDSHSGYFIIRRESGGLLAYSHKQDYGYTALTWLACECGARNVENPDGSLSHKEIFQVWTHAKAEGLIPEDDPIPGKAMWHIAREHDLYPESLIPSDWNDDVIMPPTVKNRILETVRDEYGMNPGRDDYDTPDGTPDTTPQDDEQTEIEARVEELTPGELAAPPEDYPVYELEDLVAELHCIPTAVDTVLLAVVDESGDILSELPGVEYTPGGNGGGSDVDTPQKRENRANDLLENSGGELHQMHKSSLLDALLEMGQDMQTDEFSEAARSPVVQSFINRTEDVVYQPYKGGDGTNWRVTMSADPREPEVGSKEFDLDPEIMTSNGPSQFESNYAALFGFRLPDAFGEKEWREVSDYWMSPDVRERLPVKYDSEDMSKIDRFLTRVNNLDVYDWADGEGREKMEFDGEVGLYIEDYEVDGKEKDVIAVGGAWASEWRQEYLGNFELYAKLEEYGYVAEEVGKAPNWLTDDNRRPQVLMIKAGNTDWTTEKSIDPTDEPEGVV